MANRTLTQAEYADAVTAAKEFAAPQPTDHSSLYVYGALLFRTGQYEQAITVLRACAGIEGRSAARLDHGHAKPNQLYHAVGTCQRRRVHRDVSVQTMASAKPSETLRAALRDWVKGGDRSISRAAGRDDRRSTTQPSRSTCRPAFATITDVIPASDLAELRKHVGG